jgi:hypothetical protein
MTQYYRMFLQPMNAFLEENKNLGDAMDFGQRFHNDVGEQVRNTLEIMERAGGPGAYKSIKFAIPVCKYTTSICLAFLLHPLMWFRFALIMQINRAIKRNCEPHIVCETIARDRKLCVN